MLIDWFTVGAQALNFLILVWLLKRFLYKPILNAIDVRETLIAAKLADADAKQAEAQKERGEFQRKNDELDERRAALMSKATLDARAQADKLRDEARKTADALAARRQEALRSDAQSLHQALRRRTQQEVFAIVRKALTDLAGASLEEQMTVVFIQRLATMDAKARQAFAAALKTASGPVLVRSAFDLPEAQRAAIRTSLDAAFSTQAPIRFETAPDLVGGVELTVNGQKLAWSIADYLASLEKGVAEVLDARGIPTPKPADKPLQPPAAGNPETGAGTPAKEAPRS